MFPIQKNENIIWVFRFFSRLQQKIAVENSFSGIFLEYCRMYGTLENKTSKSQAPVRMMVL